MNDLGDVEKEITKRGAETVVSELKAERASLHPDKNDGDFKTPEDEERYHFLNKGGQNTDFANIRLTNL